MPEIEPGDVHFKQVTHKFAVHINIEIIDSISTHQYSLSFPASVVCSHSLVPGFFLFSKSGMADGILNLHLSDSPSLGVPYSDRGWEVSPLLRIQVIGLIPPG